MDITRWPPHISGDHISGHMCSSTYDLGNPAVRDYRGASGDVGQGGNEIPSRNRKGVNGNPPPTTGASELYPNQTPFAPLRLCGGPPGPRGPARTRSLKP